MEKAADAEQQKTAGKKPAPRRPLLVGKKVGSLVGPQGNNEAKQRNKQLFEFMVTDQDFRAFIGGFHEKTPLCSCLSNKPFAVFLSQTGQRGSISGPSRPEKTL